MAMREAPGTIHAIDGDRNQRRRTVRIRDAGGQRESRLLYGSREEYERRVRARLDGMVDDRFLLAEDRDRFSGLR